jgi:hypothetical protein
LEWLASFKRKTASQKRHVLLLTDQFAAFNSEGTALEHVHLLYVAPPATSHMQQLAPTHDILYQTRILMACSMLFLVTNGNVPAKTKENGTSWMTYKVFL